MTILDSFLEVDEVEVNPVEEAVVVRDHIQDQNLP